jgi:hypothetical protein
VKNEHKASREHRWQPSADACSAYLEALSVKRTAIRKAKALYFKLALANAIKGGNGIQPLAKWATQRLF